MTDEQDVTTDEQGVKRLTMTISAKSHTKLKVITMMEGGLSQSAVIEKLIDDYMKRHRESALMFTKAMMQKRKEDK